MTRRAALVPIKAFARAKSRLAGAVPPGARAVLARELATKALDAIDGLRARRELDEVLVLTDCEAVATWARERGCGVLADGPGQDLAALVDRGLEELAQLGVDEVLVVMADLPEVHTGALARVLGQPPIAVPDHHGTGTNVLLVCPTDAAPTAFGHPDSLARHRRSLGPGLEVRAIAGLMRDLDLPGDLDDDEATWLWGRPLS